MPSWPCRAVHPYEQCIPPALCTASCKNGISTLKVLSSFQFSLCLYLSIPVSLPVSQVNVGQRSEMNAALLLTWKFCGSKVARGWKMKHQSGNIWKPTLNTHWKYTLKWSSNEFLWENSLVHSGHLKTCTFWLVKWVSKWEYSSGLWV